MTAFIIQKPGRNAARVFLTGPGAGHEWSAVPAEAHEFASKSEANAALRDINRIERMGAEVIHRTDDLTQMTADDFTASVIAGAIEFTATLSLGRGKYETRRAPDIEGARQHAREINAPGRVLIYAVNAAGRTAYVETI